MCAGLREIYIHQIIRQHSVLTAYNAAGLGICICTEFHRNLVYGIWEPQPGSVHIEAYIAHAGIGLAKIELHSPSVCAIKIVIIAVVMQIIVIVPVLRNLLSIGRNAHYCL